MADVNLRNVKKSYGKVEVLHDINLDINRGEFIVFVGPSGCGKSTLLRMIAGLEVITGGELSIGGALMNKIPPSMRGIAMVFQSYALYPHMTVYDNMAFSMRLTKASKEEIDAQVKNAADILQLGPFLDRLPKALSGGQRQRVAIGRAIVRNPDVFLFDEPLSNLDAALRVATRLEIANLKESMPETTMIYVTHDQVEAMTLADRIVVLSAGYIEQVGSPLDLYTDPANLFVAQFIGSPAMNIIPATVAQTGAVSQVKISEGKGIQVPIATNDSLSGAAVKFGVRPEDLQIAKTDNHLFEGTISFVESLGEVTLLHLEVAGSNDLIVVKVPGITDFAKGNRVRVTADASKLHLFDDAGLTLRGRA
ncbi:MAG: sn-glycerol-3-phosphate ABC transporter ATP-binding protein UgpC [Granulosicoccus sp.]